MNGMVESVFAYVLVVLGAFYIAAIAALRVGLRALAARSQQNNSLQAPQQLPFISIVISARDEEHTIHRLIACLVQQDYPREKFEVIFVDDRSQDGTWGILEAASREHPFVKAVRINDVLPGFAPKKRALDMAIRNARGEVILLTDADCTPPATWARTMVGSYHDGVAGVVGYSPYRFDTPVPQLVQGMLALDYFSLFALAAASSGLGKALTASGTNFSYRRQTYLDIGGFESVKGMISGDDDLFVNEVTRRKAGKFSFALDPQSYVPAAAPKSWRQFWNQRIRYASKGRHYGGAMTIGLIAVYLLNLCIIAGLVAPPFGVSGLLWTTLAVWGAKSMMELSLLRHAAELFHEQRLLKFFLPTVVLHPLYVTVFGFLGLFAKFTWKG
ncbi:MAG: glycosyltransferase [Ignavibacteriae bacterium]|nr:glycosyltransferase [Ignavibacteriota bacterium]